MKCSVNIWYIAGPLRGMSRGPVRVVAKTDDNIIVNASLSLSHTRAPPHVHIQVHCTHSRSTSLASKGKAQSSIVSLLRSSFVGYNGPSTLLRW